MTLSHKVLDCRGLRCPLPVLKARKALSEMAEGAVLAVLSDDPVAGLDMPLMVLQEGHRLAGEVTVDETGCRRFTIMRGARPAA